MQKRKNIHLLAIVAFCICFLSVITNSLFAQSAKVYEILTRNISAISGIPTYQTKMTSGDTFLYLIFPGFPFALDELSFSTVSGNELFGNNLEVNKAYRFAKLVNKVIEPGDITVKMNRDLEQYLRGGSFITSATYNDTFCLVTITPKIPNEGLHWSFYESDETDANTGENYSIKTSLARINLERGWLDKAGKPNNIPDNSAIIKEILFAKELSLSGKKDDKQFVNIKNDGIIIIGFICMVL